ncbi:MAG: penicillin-binding protein 2, penicillin-binding protein 2 [Parcubacteria group bacterium]|nr:penicillin-binding protein 2, penicillin-binding protein 2 [Parcubacteria group bacterium]
MHKQFLRNFKKRFRRQYQDINPEDIFLDSANLPGFAEHRFEGRIEKPISERTFFVLKCVLCIVVFLFCIKLWNLQIHKGTAYAEVSENNRLAHTLIFANRGLIYDRNKVELATNAVKDDASGFSSRLYPPVEGLAHVVGYLKYPAKDSSGHFYEEAYKGQAGVEKVYNDSLSGKNGLKITETDALGKVVSESVIEKPEDGNDLTLSIDSRFNIELYKAIANIAHTRGFTGGAGVVMDVETGEILALTSYPEYNQNIVTEGADRKAISELFTSKDQPFLDRATSGLYTPGSIVKPIMGLAALNEGVIDANKQILSTGSISVPNPYDKTKPSIFRDWKALGWVDLKDALAVSSDVYFYEVGGGFEGQKGIGINAIDKYYELFGMTEKTGIDLPGESAGVIPSPEWKKENFNGEPWRLGDTYITSIGQYGTQVTALEAVRWVGAIANGGKLLVPSVVIGGKPATERVFRTIDLPYQTWQTVRDGMRQGVTTGIVTALNHPAVAFAAKTGTAELGVTKQLVNSWSTGFWPYDHPRYAFAVLMEKGDRNNTVGATYAMQEVENWMIINAPEYLK